MPIEILMPSLSPTMETGNLAKWLVKEGDKVSAGDVIAEIETDKATMEVEAADEGTVARILVAEGTEDVPVNQPIAVLLEDGEDAGALKSPPTPKKREKAKQDTAPKAPDPPKAAAKPSILEAAPAVSAPKKTNGDGRVFASPLARRIAAERGVDLAAINGTGPHGRIVKRDVETAVPGAAPAKADKAAAGGISLKYGPEGYFELPHDGMRKTIARRLVESKQTIPHYYLSADCDLNALMKLRKELNAEAPKDADGNPEYRLSVNDFVIKALAMALQKVPMANATWSENARLIYKHSDVGVAVAVPDGLFTPVIRAAEQKTLSAISAEIKDLAARARTKKLKPGEYQGGATSISNLGMYGVKEFSAVINPPHATILAVGAGIERPVVKSGRIVIATLMTVTLSCDHRVVDGALGAELIGAFKDAIEKPLSMLV